MSIQVAMFRRRPGQGHSRIWHVLERRLNGFMFVAPFPCSPLQAELICERAGTNRLRLMTGDVATLERHVCRHCIGAVRRRSVA